MSNWASAAAKAQGQRGVITLEQLGRFGVTWPAVKWAVTTGRLVRMFPRAYRFPAVPPTWEQRALAAALLVEGSALSHASAAAVWGLNGFGAAAAQGIHLSLPDRRQARLPADFTIHRPSHGFEVYERCGLPVTRLARTIIDIAPLVTEERLEIILDAAQHRHRALARWLEVEVARHVSQSQPGLRRLVELLALRGGVGTESPAETRARRAMRAYGIPPPRLQFSIFDADGFVMRADFAWPQYRVAAHLDGFVWHAHRLPFDRDAMQRSRLAALDWVSIVVTHTALEDAGWLRQLEAALQRRTPQKELFASAWG